MNSEVLVAREHRKRERAGHWQSQRKSDGDENGAISNGIKYHIVK